MPVADHPTHERTKIGSDFKYSCHNRPAFKKFYYVAVRRYLADGRYVMGQEKVWHKMTKDCQSVELWDTDPGCKKCKHRNKLTRKET